MKKGYLRLFLNRPAQAAGALLFVLGFNSWSMASDDTSRLPSRLSSFASGELRYAYDVVYESSDSGISGYSAFIPEPTDNAVTWAQKVNGYLLSDEVIEFIDNRYTAAESYYQSSSVRNFVYFYGFDMTSQDLRARVLYGIDERQELSVRKSMTSSLRGYMLGKGLMKYLRTINFARPYIDTVKKVEKASQLNVEIGEKDETTNEIKNPWKLAAGPDIGSQTLFVRANNNEWKFELRDTFSTSDLRFSSAYSIHRSKYILRYFNRGKIVRPQYSHKLAKNWWGSWSADVPVTGSDIGNRLFNRVELRHLF